MRIFLTLALFCAAFASALSGAQKNISLAEKIAMAKKMADDGVAGKAEIGRVVSGDFNFSEELAKFRGYAEIPADEEELGITEDDTGVIEEEAHEIPAEPPAIIPDAQELEKIEVVPEAEVKVEDIPANEAVEFPKKQEKKEYVPVDTEKDFVGEFFVGSIDDEKNGPKIREEVIEESKEKKYFSFQNDMFDLVTDNYDALISGIVFVRECEDLMNKYFAAAPAKIKFMNRITLQISDKDEFDFDGHFSVMVSDSGEITLAVKWNETLKIEDFCKLLTGAALRRYAYENLGDAASKNIAYWLELSFATMLEHRMRFGVPADLARLSSEQPPKDLQSVMEYSREDGVDLALKESHAYWTFVAIERAAVRRVPMYEFLRVALDARNAEKVREMIFDRMKPAEYDFALWWRALVMGEIWSRMSGIYTPEKSEAEILRMAVVQVDTPEGERVGISVLPDLWYNRENIRRDVELRIVEIKVSLARMNPLFHNCAVSLGLMFEKLIDGDEDEFREAAAVFVAEFKSARALAERAKKMMAEPYENANAADK